MALRISSLARILILAGPSAVFAQGPQTTDNHIKVDQFGHLPGDAKIAVISNPVTGYNSTQSFTPGTTYEVRAWSDRSVVFSGAPVSWKSGATHAQSGDKVWWFDFSSVNTPGSYYVYDPARSVGSYRFEINACAYHEPLKQALRTFYYQRCGCAKAAPYAGAGWVDAACHVGAQQDKDCRLYNDNSAATSHDLSGGWHDAGDYNKYVNFAWGAVVDLLLACDESPAVWDDASGIPESGNGVPDILDEVKYELDWLLRMQQGNGSVLCVVGGGGASPPSADHAARTYGPATTSAAYAAASMVALAAIEFGKAGQSAYTTTLRTAAENAWTWAQANPAVTFTNSGKLAAGEQETDAYGTLSRRLAAACFLYALTGATAYKTWFDANYAQAHLIQWSSAYPFETTLQDALLYYAKAANATAAVVADIQGKYSQSVKTGGENLPTVTNGDDAYRAYLKDGDYTWGSNSTKCKKAGMYLNMAVYNLDAGNAAAYRRAALGFVNYMHGVNPTAFAYLSNMGAYGAENSINEFYHSWFADGSQLWDRASVSTYGPAPGFVPGGPNPSFALDGCCPSGCANLNNLCVPLSPPSGQPIQKSYRDWNTSWPQDSWSVTENGIYYQAAYVRMVSHFAASSCPVTRTVRMRDNPLVRVVCGKGASIILRSGTFAMADQYIQIFDAAGNLLRQIRIDNPATSLKIDLGVYGAGIYFLRTGGQSFRIVRNSGQ